MAISSTVQGTRRRRHERDRERSQGGAVDAGHDAPGDCVIVMERWLVKGLVETDK